MCGRFSLKTTPDTLERIFGQAVPPGYRPRYNIAPSQEVLAIVAECGAARATMLRWGLVPFWATDPSIGTRLINARVEGAATKPAFRNAFARHRCLIVADGFYEWRKSDEGKRPHWIRPADEEPFAMAGLWERWDRGETPIESCTILTTASNPFMRSIHERMPVILPAASRAEWLSAETGTDRLHRLLDEARSVALKAHEVSTLVNRPANDLPECIDPVGPEPRAGEFDLSAGAGGGR